MSFRIIGHVASMYFARKYLFRLLLLLLVLVVLLLLIITTLINKKICYLGCLLTRCLFTNSLFQPVLHDWCNKGRGMCYPVCGMVHIKEPLLLIGKSSLCGGSRFPLSLSEWSFTMSDAK